MNTQNSIYYTYTYLNMATRQRPCLHVMFKSLDFALLEKRNAKLLHNSLLKS